MALGLGRRDAVARGERFRPARTRLVCVTNATNWLHAFRIRLLLMTDRDPAPDRVSRLRGRRTECAALDEMIAAIRDGESRTLVVRGEAGVGKTALLEYVVESASDLRVVRAVGVETEMELAFCGLASAVRP